MFFVFQSDHSEIKILPQLPVEFHAGRFINLHCSHGLIDMEWSKKQIRCLHFHAAQNGVVDFIFQKNVKSCRVRKGDQDRGNLVQLPLSLNFEAYPNYYFDNFQS